jgi:hypothetical protein
LVTRPEMVVPCANATEATIALAPMTDRIRLNIVMSLLHDAPRGGAIGTYAKYHRIKCERPPSLLTTSFAEAGIGVAK